MIDRSNELLQIRPEIKTTQLNDAMSIGELFQNETLRPILKFQNELLIAVFKDYIKKYKNAFYELSIAKRELYIEHAIQKDIKFKNAITGIIIGQFTIEEYKTYTLNPSALNKRIMQMVIERLKNQIQVFENNILIN